VTICGVAEPLNYTFLNKFVDLDIKEQNSKSMIEAGLAYYVL
jgi:hypothetical protein